MNRKLNYLICVFSALLSTFCVCNHVYTHTNWKYHFPPGGSMGIFLAVAFPFDLKPHTAFLAYNFEAIYAVPNYSQTTFQYPPVVQRKFVYDALESKIDRNGYFGKGCLLRTICEASSTPIHESSGVLGDILHVLLKPSSSEDDNITSEYEEAELAGVKNDCSDYKQNCTISFLDLFSL